MYSTSVRVEHRDGARWDGHRDRTTELRLRAGPVSGRGRGENANGTRRAGRREASWLGRAWARLAWSVEPDRCTPVVLVRSIPLPAYPATPYHKQPPELPHSVCERLDQPFTQLPYPPANGLIVYSYICWHGLAFFQICTAQSMGVRTSNSKDACGCAVDSRGRDESEQPVGCSVGHLDCPREVPSDFSDAVAWMKAYANDATAANDTACSSLCFTPLHFTCKNNLRKFRSCVR
jgi:hypothetical protein